MKRKKNKPLTQLEAMKKVRKPMPPKTKVIKSKKDKLREISDKLMEDFEVTYKQLS